MKRGKTEIAVAEVAVVVIEELLDSCSHQDLTTVVLEGSWEAEVLVPHVIQGSWVVGSWAVEWEDWGSEESLVADRTSFEAFGVDGSIHCASSPRVEAHPVGAFVVKVAG